jgi:hypothetical protein
MQYSALPPVHNERGARFSVLYAMGDTMRVVAMYSDTVRKTKPVQFPLLGVLTGKSGHIRRNVGRIGTTARLDLSRTIQSSWSPDPLNEMKAASIWLHSLHFIFITPNNRLWDQFWAQKS